MLMVCETGVNVGIPVPREPFAFGGLTGTLSKYGDFDVTAEGAMEFFTNRRKVRAECSTLTKPSQALAIFVTVLLSFR